MQATRRGRAGGRGSGRGRKGGAKAAPKAAALPRRTGRSGYAGALRPAYLAGFADASALHRSGGAPAGPDAKLRMNEHWTRYCQRGGRRARGPAQGRAYADGFADGLRLPRRGWVPVALARTASAVVLAGSRASAEAVEQLLRLPFQDVVVVLENAGPDAFARLRDLPDVTIVHTRERLGADVGRTVGARMTRAELVLFADGEAAVPAEQLAVLLAEAHAGCDLVLADVSGQLGPFRGWDDAARIRAFVNWSLGHPELNANSVAVLPHVWSRAGLERVGLPQLAVPPMAQRAAIELGLRIRCRPVAAPKPGAGADPAGAAAKAKLAAGDHIEALRAAMRAKGARLSLPDLARRRSAAGGRLP
ncbi:hypothetical protein SAMN02799624_03099 [Paenibacillus sp. UNC496MF]|uniref:hypothetical protein n=1 Tax=Paenibacillus sp. UNC496MF TaxID=1502753 RepID=UPI0008F1F0E5|nr:hypothetical protein [Paenibacillus sp. UNC496MF]SFJ03285.1 hypothetical protein SAMN02799624_03099 [Paenibacillus sp. UNC496MF]